MKLLRIFALLMLSSLSACAAISPVRPDVAITNAQITDVSLFETGMEFKLKVSNHNPEPLAIDGAVYRIAINGTDIGTGSSGEKLDIPAFGSANQTVRVSLSNLSMINNIRSLVESQRFDYEIDGEFYLSNSGLWPKKARIEKTAHFDFREFSEPFRRDDFRREIR